MLSQIATGESETVMPLIMKDFEEHDVKQYVNTKVKSIENNVIFATNTKDGADITIEEKKVIFSKFALPKILKRIGLKENECIIPSDALDEIMKIYTNTSGIRDLEQAAEHIAAHTLYQIEVNHVTSVTFTADMIRKLLV